MDVYIYQADIYCEGCAIPIMKRLSTDCGIFGAHHPDIGVDCRAFHQKRLRHFWEPPAALYDSDDFPKGPYPDGGGAADAPQHCGSCRVFVNNPLTPDGIKYVYEKIDDCLNGLSGTPSVLAVWAETYQDSMTYFPEAPGDNNCNTDMAWRNVIQTLKDMSGDQT